jgi:hypothetical protein
MPESKLSRRDSLKIMAAALTVPFAPLLRVEAGAQAVAATQFQPNSRRTTCITPVAPGAAVDAPEASAFGE